MSGGPAFDPPVAANTTFSYDADNRLAMVGTVPVTYDANGQLLSDGTRTFTWDVRGRLTGISATGSNSQFTYDPSGLRTGKVVDGVATSYLLDGQNVVSEISGGNSIHTLHGPLVDQPLARGGLYFSQDPLGSTTMLTDSTGSVVQQYRYSPFGETSRSTAVNNPFQFTGRENDETGLYYYRARYYAPQWGRFVSQDPIGFEGGDNLYAYVENDPVNEVDADGQGKPLMIDLSKNRGKKTGKKTGPPGKGPAPASAPDAGTCKAPAPAPAPTPLPPTPTQPPKTDPGLRTYKDPNAPRDFWDRSTSSSAENVLNGAGQYTNK